MTDNACVPVLDEKTGLTWGNCRIYNFQMWEDCRFYVKPGDNDPHGEYCIYQSNCVCKNEKAKEDALIMNALEKI